MYNKISSNRKQRKADLTHQKLRESILQCIKLGSDNDNKIPKTKLAKLIYLADFLHFYEHNHPITGFDYRKLPHGPVTLEYFDELEALQEEGLIRSEKKANAEMITATNKASMVNTLTVTEIDIIAKVSKKWKNKKADEIVKFTHNQLPWRICGENHKIPYVLIIQEDGDLY